MGPVMGFAKELCLVKPFIAPPRVNNFQRFTGLSLCSLVYLTAHWSVSLLTGLSHYSLVCLITHWSVSLLNGLS